MEATAVWLPKRVINKWPATILAIKRTERVIGRITFLIDSISTIKGIKAEGVLWGTKWANMWFVWLTQPNNIKLSHKGRANVKVKVMWLEDVKMYGKRPRKLFIKIKINKAINMKEEPWREEGPKSVLNSEWSLFKMEERRAENFLGANQKEGIINIRNKTDLNQFKEILKFAEGSKTENKFVIIFNWFEKFLFCHCLAV